VDLSWRRLGNAHDRLMDQLLNFVRDSLDELPLLVAAGEFLLWPETDENPGDLIKDHMQLFVPWFVFNWTYDPDETDVHIDMPAHQTIAQVYADRYGERLDDHQKRLIESINNRPYSFLEVVSCNPGQGFRLKDVLTGTEEAVIENQGSENAKPGDMLLGRITKVDHVVMLVGCSSTLIPPGWKTAIIDLRRLMKKKVGHITTDLLIEYDYDIRDLYFHIVDTLNRPPQLQNTDGDRFLFHTLHYTIEDPQDTFDKLADLSVVEDVAFLRREAGLDTSGRIVRVEIPWSKEGNEMHKGWNNTLLGRLVIDKHKLTVEVNSETRAKIIRQKIKKRLGAGATYKTTKIQSPEAMMKANRYPESAGKEESLNQEELMQIPEIREHVEKTLAAHWDGWVDRHIPALNNQTPMQAIKTADGREKVEALLIEAERHSANDMAMRTVGPEIIDDIRRRLGFNNAPSEDGKKVGKDKKKPRIEEIKSLIEGFGRTHLDAQHIGFALKLCDHIVRMRKLNIQRGRVEIWAAAIIHVIARLNFLFDPESDLFITTDDICNHFGTVKSTVGNKATGIEKACKLEMGNKDFCRPDIVDMFTFYETSDGFIMPKSMLSKFETDGRPAKEGGSQSGRLPADEPTRRKKKETRTMTMTGYNGQKESARQIAEKKKKEEPHYRQLKLFDDA